MKILITGGSGDLGQMVGPLLTQLGHELFNLDLIDHPQAPGRFIKGSIVDRLLLAQLLPQVDCVLHIAALHGIHEFRQTASPTQFWDVNVTGTFNLLQAAVEAQVNRFIFISSTSVEDKDSFYGHTKVLAEQLGEHYQRSYPNFSWLCLRPRAFIPPWNKAVYTNFVEWAKWFWGGAVHIQDVAQATVQAVQLLNNTPNRFTPPLVLDGKYDYTAEELAKWDEAGPGSTFQARYGLASYQLALQHGLDPAVKPAVRDISAAQKFLGYQPTYSLQNLLQELGSVDILKITVS